jgi:hypothetical protein
VVSCSWKSSYFYHLDEKEMENSSLDGSTKSVEMDTNRSSSLQGLVLNSKPYFNEVGYDKQIGRAEGEKNSLAYNENSFLLSCKSMLYFLRKPPKV